MLTIVRKDGEGGQAGAGWLLALGWVLLGTGIALLLYSLDRGWDLTDESFYLHWIQDPRTSAFVYQPFGYLLHPLYRGLGESLPLLRGAGLLAFVASGALFCWSAGRLIERHHGLTAQVPLALCGALAAVASHFHWVLTPNYNQLGNIGAQLFAAALMGLMPHRDEATTLKARQGWSWAWTAVLGAGATIAFFGKPLVLLFLSPAALFVLVRRWKALGWSAAVMPFAAGAILCLAAVSLILLPYTDLPTLLRTALESQQLLTPSNTLGSLVPRTVRELGSAPLLFLVSLFFYPAILWLGRRHANLARLAALGLLALSFAYLAAKFPWALLSGSGPNRIGMVLWCCCTALLSLVAVELRAARRATNLLYLLALLAFAAALGSFNILLEQLTVTMFFPVAILFMTASLFLKRPWLAGILLLTPLLLLWGSLRPYGLPTSIYAQSLPLAEGPLAGQKVDHLTRDYVEGLRLAGSRHGLTSSTPVLDLSGTGTGNVLALGAEPPVIPWIFHVTPDIADLVWDRMSVEQREQAWIVGPIAPEFAGSRTALALKRNASRYACVGVFPMRFWNRDRVTTLWKPGAGGEGRCGPLLAP